MVFIEFTKQEGGLVRFIGKTQEDVLEDTNNGKRFGTWSFTAYRAVTREEVQALGLRLFKKGVKAISSGETKSFMLG